MQNEATKTRSQNMAFLVDADFLQRMETVLGELKGTLEYNVQFSDGTTVKFPKVKDIIGQPNSSECRIVSIIAGVEGQNGHSAYLTMRHQPSPSVEYTVTGPQRDVIYFAAKLDELVASSRQWYSWFFSSGIGFLVGCAAVLGPLVVWDTLYRHFFVGLASKGKAPGWLALTGIGAMWAIEYGVSKLFPRGTFAIGHGLKRHKEITGLRIGVLGAFAVSVLADWVLRHF